MNSSNFSIYFVWGDNAGFRIENNKRVKRIVLWKFSMAFVKIDLEQLLDHALKIVEYNKGQKNETNE